MYGSFLTFIIAIETEKLIPHKNLKPYLNESYLRHQMKVIMFLILSQEAEHLCVFANRLKEMQ